MKLKFRYRVLLWAAPVLAAACNVLLAIATYAHHGFSVAWRCIRAAGRRIKQAYGRMLFHLLRLRIHYFAQVSEKAKCPACGVRAQHKIQWADMYQAVMHECGRCKAHWGEKPLVKLEAWFVKPLPLPGEQPMDSEVKTTTKIRQVV